MFEVAMMKVVPKSTLVHLPILSLSAGPLTWLSAASSSGGGREQTDGAHDPTETRK